MELIRSKFTYENVSYLIEQGLIKNINAVSPVLGGLTLLHLAVFNDDKKLVEYLLCKGADINSKSQCWGTVFNIAVIVNNLTTIQSLISFGMGASYINHPIEFSELRRFVKAVEKYGQEIPAEFLLGSHICMHTIDDFGDSVSATLPLNIAIIGGNVKMVELLLKNNANPNLDADSYGSPLIFATIRGNLSIIKLLLDCGSDVNIVQGPFGKSPLHIAVQKNHPKVVELFLNHDMIDINTETINKYSALHYGTVYLGHRNVMKPLLDAGIDVNLKNDFGETAFTLELMMSNNLNYAITNSYIFEHIVKCSTANFFLNEENLAVLNSEKFGELRDQCINEIKKMKITFIGTSNVTYHYVLYNKCVHKLALSLKYVSDSTILDLPIESIFPLYAGMINYRLKKH